MDYLNITFDKSGLEVNSIAISAISGILFFVVAHPFLFSLVDSILSNIISIDSIPRDLLLLIHSFVFMALMYVTILLVINYL